MERVFDMAPDDRGAEASLRPSTLEEFVGQDRIRKNLRVYIEAARRRGEALDHLLFSGLPGLGKTTLSLLIAAEMGTEFKASSGPALEKPGDLVGILTNLKRGDVFFIDEIHRLSPVVEEYLYSAMEDFSLDLVIDQGPSARSVKIHLERFTLVGATTREGMLTQPFRARFGVLEKLEPYPWEQLVEILVRSARLLEIGLEPSAAELIARRARGTPRIANRFLRRIRDVAQVEGVPSIHEQVAQRGLAMMEVDPLGLEALDRKLLGLIADLGGGPVGLKTLAVSVGEDAGTIEDVYEPFLIQQQFLIKTPRGRMLTEQAYHYLGRRLPPRPTSGDLYSSESSTP